jgi:diguanylate cyclase (GGDEF)-like protein
MRTSGALVEEFVMSKIRSASRVLPEKPSLENLKKQARTLRNAVTAGAAEAEARVRNSHPRAGVLERARFSLSDAQLVVAREYGFESWPKLSAHVSERAAASVGLVRLEAGAILPLIVLGDRVLGPHERLDWIPERDGTKRALEAALTSPNGLALCVAQRAAATLEPTRDDLYDMGALARVEKVRGSRGAACFRLRYQGRARLTRLIDGEQYRSAEVEPRVEPSLSAQDTRALVERLYQRLELVARGVEWFSKSELAGLRQAGDLPGLIAAGLVHCDLATKQALLESLDPKGLVERLCRALEPLVREQGPRPLGAPDNLPSDPADAAAGLVVLYAAGHPHLLGRRYALSEPSTTIGRYATNQVQLHSDSVSRGHARIERRDGKFALVDQASTNGSFVNEAPEAVTERVLEDGDRLAIGDAILAFVCGPDLDQKYRAAVEYITRHDALTRTLNQKSWLAETERRIFLARGTERALSALLVEIDQLPELSERLGALGGNALLLRVARVLREQFGDAAVIGRLTSNRFALTLPDTDAERATELAQQLCLKLSTRSLSLLGETVTVTASVGVATVYRTTGADELVEDALAALERATDAGRNAVRGPREVAA